MYNTIQNNLFCQYCGKQCKHLNSLTQHEKRCPSNPNRLITNFSNPDWRNQNVPKRTGIAPWNKGLTTNTDSRLKAYGKKISKTLTGNSTGRASTPEKEEARKAKISATMKKNKKAGGIRPGSGRGKKGKYKGYYCDSTYELVYIIYNIDHNIKFDRCDFYYTYQYKGEYHKYFPDFILADGSLVEIKGYLTDKVQEKIKSVTDRKISLLLEKDLKYAFDYVKKNYTYKKLTDLYD